MTYAAFIEKQKPCHFHATLQHNSWIKLKLASPTVGCGLSCSLHKIIDDKHTTIKEVQCCCFLQWRNMSLSLKVILSLADHSQFRDPCCGNSLWGKWGCIYFSNQIQWGILPTVENTVRLSGLISFRINKYVFSKTTAVFSNLWDHSNPTTHLELGTELNNWILFQAEVTNRHPRWTAENWYWIELSPSGCSRPKNQQFHLCISSRNNTL